MSWVQVELQFEVRGLRGSCCLEAQHGINFHSGFFEDSMLWQRALERRSGSYLPKSPVDEQPGVRNGLFPSLSMCSLSFGGLDTALRSVAFGVCLRLGSSVSSTSA